MKTYQKTLDDRTYFALAEIDPALHDALRMLVFNEFEDGFARSFPSHAPHYHGEAPFDRLFENFTRDIPDLILQAAGLQPAPWEKGLRAFLDIVEGHNINWWLVGSAALAVRGIPVTPHDIDLVVQDQDTHRLSELLADYMLEPVIHSQDWVGEWFCRTFLHVRLEWVGDVNPHIDQPEHPADFGLVALARSETVEWQGYSIKIPPLDLQLAISEQRGLTERVQLIREFMA